jgi:hypothetical protein
VRWKIEWLKFDWLVRQQIMKSTGWFDPDQFWIRCTFSDSCITYQLRTICSHNVYFFLVSRVLLRSTACEELPGPRKSWIQSDKPSIDAVNDNIVRAQRRDSACTICKRYQQGNYNNSTICCTPLMIWSWGLLPIQNMIRFGCRCPGIW